MLLRRLLFETRAGTSLLNWLERRAGLSIVATDWLGDQPACEGLAAAE